VVEYLPSKYKALSSNVVHPPNPSPKSPPLENKITLGSSEKILYLIFMILRGLGGFSYLQIFLDTVHKIFYLKA
jgi:hypothetical protein